MIPAPLRAGLASLTLSFLWLAPGCATPPPPREVQAPVAAVEDEATLAADRARQEEENRQLLLYRAEQKRRDDEAAAAARRAEAESVKVTRLADLQKQREAEEARLRAEAAERDRAAADARLRVARARESVAAAAPGGAPEDPETRLARRRADPRWTRPGFSGLLCALRADRDRAAQRLQAEKKKGKKADAARLSALERRMADADARARQARGELQKLRLSPLACKDGKTAEVAACFRASDAGKPCKKGLADYVELVRSFPGA